MRLGPTILFASLLAFLSATPGRAFTDGELIDGFMRTVFGSEYPTWGAQASMVKRFTGPVRVYIDDRSSARRGGEVAAFVRTLPRLIAGIRVFVVSDPSAANFRVFVLDRADYRPVVSREVYGRTTSTYAPGKCLVRVVSSSSGISRSDAAIVADEGEFLFRRCLVEELLQGLGPVNDDPALAESVFNDRSEHSSFTRFDRHILNMLYHPLVRPGMSSDQVRQVLPAVAADVRARLR
ncbi:MAG: DUF2927 domain-containing protein [Propylenella sp.]